MTYDGAPAHTATWTYTHDEYLVTCPHGCNLGTSAHAATEEQAHARVDLHRIATTPFGRLNPDERKDVTARALARLQAELQANADAIGAILAEDDEQFSPEDLESEDDAVRTAAATYFQARGQS